RVLGPTDGLAPVVRAGGEAVRAPERGQRRHDAVFPAEAETLVSDRCWGREEGGAAPALTQRVRLGRLRDAGDDAAVVLHRPEHTAVRTAERPEIGERAVPPEGGVLHLISGQVRGAGDPAQVVDAVARADSPAERIQIDHVVAGLRAWCGRRDTGALNPRQ